MTCANVSTPNVDRVAKNRTTHEDFFKFIGKKTPNLYFCLDSGEFGEYKVKFAEALKPVKFPVKSLTFVN